MTVASPARNQIADETRSLPTGLGRNVAWLVLAMVSALWLRITWDAWRIRSIVSEYVAIHGGYDIRPSWPEHFRVFHDDLMGVGADYFYPFAWGVIVVAGLTWVGAAAVATANLGRLRWAAVSAGVTVLILELVVLGPALITYINVTD